jgi:uncharacterized repeat protein (TIGR03837 family)
MRWDIFCQVIDNYGDIGVCWRLARQLASEHGLEVRLWLDDLASLQPLCPEADPKLDSQRRAGVEIRRWQMPFAQAEVADVVIEAFGCPLPENYVAAMAHRLALPCWVNLEYLSAEPWIDGCHGLTSPHPRLPLTKHFYFPGFTPTSGGLLREHDLLDRRQHWQRDPQQLRNALRLPPPAEDETLVSLFCYDSAPIADLLAGWAAAPTPVRCLMPEGKAVARAAAWFDDSVLAPGDTRRRTNLTLHVLPFVRQEDYDLLLWACDCNFVRGEDSFVRAQWALRPLVWQIYKQEEDAHHAKLDAFLDRYCAGLDDGVAEAVRSMHRAWNGIGTLDWAAFWRHRPALQAHAAAWSEQQAQESDLASKLVIFCKNRV